MGKISALIKNFGLDTSDIRSSLFLFLASWTVMILTMGWLNFFIPTLPLPDVAITSYLILLGVYIVHKEVNRWTGVKMSAKPGELIVFVWWFSLLVMVLFNFLTQLHVPEGIKFMSYEILGALLASEISKSLNAYRLKTEQNLNRSAHK
ncbi:MAG: hypothetical protein HYT65_00050 [Candidatus Yanofskybacteria bacterium]|nr:hypothetical protein [Candidatus Yanofskybacteria bacterium]